MVPLFLTAQVFVEALNAGTVLECAVAIRLVTAQAHVAVMPTKTAPASVEALRCPIAQVYAEVLLCAIVLAFAVVTQ